MSLLLMYEAMIAFTLDSLRPNDLILHRERESLLNKQEDFVITHEYMICCVRNFHSTFGILPV